MKRHALIAAALLALAARATTASAAVATSPSGDPTSGVALLVAVCADGSEWMAVAPQDSALSLVVPFDVVDGATPAAPVECVALPAWPLPGGTVVPDPTGVSAQDAAVWSRGAQPVVRASDEP